MLWPPQAEDTPQKYANGAQTWRDTVPMTFAPVSSQWATKSEWGKTKVTAFWNLILKETTHHFCHLKQVTKSSGHSNWGDCTRAWIPSDGYLWGPIWSCLHWTKSILSKHEVVGFAGKGALLPSSLSRRGRYGAGGGRQFSLMVTHSL